MALTFDFLTPIIYIAIFLSFSFICVQIIPRNVKLTRLLTFLATKFHENPSSGSGEVENVKSLRGTVSYDNSLLEPSAQVR